MTKTQIITICIHYLRRSSCEERKAPVSHQSSCKSLSWRKWGAAETGRNSGDRDEGVVSIKLILL